ncbi:hypothetical protein [Sinobaca sp. H24]|nr:hypothetical protein [Sinobaca sp. H24]
MQCCSQWDFVALAGYFLAMGILVGIIAGMSGNESATVLTTGSGSG